MENVSDKILLDVFEYMNITDLLECTLVNRYWNTLINEHCLVLQDRLRLNLTPFRCQLIEMNPDMLQRRYKHLVLTMHTIVQLPSWLPPLLADVEDIAFVNCVFDRIQCFREVLSCFAQLKSVGLRDVILRNGEKIELVTGSPEYHRTIERFKYTLTENADNERLIDSWKLMKAFQVLSPIRLLTVECQIRANIGWDDVREFVEFLLEHYADKLCSFDFDDINLAQLLKIMKLAKSLRLEHFGIENRPVSVCRFDENFQLFVQQQAQSLTSFRLKNATEQSLTAICRHLPQLASLEVFLETDVPNFRHLLRKLKMLKTLLLHPAQAVDYKLDLPMKLERLEVVPQRTMQHLLFLQKLSTLKLVATEHSPIYAHLTKLVLDNVKVHEKTFQVVFGKMPNLTHFELINTCGRMSSSLLIGRVGRDQQAHSLKNLKRLEYLCLDDFLVKDAVLFELQAKGLKKFCLNSYWERTRLVSTNLGLRALSKQCPLLQVVTDNNPVAAQRIIVFKRSHAMGLFRTTRHRFY